jgi:hypothetical protein
MELLNPEQLVCTGCHREVVETERGWIHLDGSVVEDCAGEVGGDAVGEVAA